MVLYLYIYCRVLLFKAFFLMPTRDAYTHIEFVTEPAPPRNIHVKLRLISETKYNVTLKWSSGPGKTDEFHLRLCKGRTGCEFFLEDKYVPVTQDSTQKAFFIVANSQKTRYYCRLQAFSYEKQSEFTSAEFTIGKRSYLLIIKIYIEFEDE